LEVLGGRGDQIVAEARGWPAVIGLAAMRGEVGVASGLPPDDLYRFFAEDLFQSASPQLREALFLLALAGVDGSHALLGSDHVELVIEATERGFITGGETQRVHPLLRGFLIAKLRDQDESSIRARVGASIEYLVERHRWDDCLSVLEHFPDDSLILSTLEQGMAEILDSGRVVSLCRWLGLARERSLHAPLLLAAAAEIALREGDSRKAMVLGELAGSELTGDLAARAYLVGARAAHLGDNPAETSRLCELTVATASTPSIQMDALWTALSSATEQMGANESKILERLRRFKGPSAVHASRLFTAKAFVLARSGDVRAAANQLEFGGRTCPRSERPVRPDNRSTPTCVYVLASCSVRRRRHYV
jgi:hypothetical protein